jgi:hypothetical protein
MGEGRRILHGRSMPTLQCFVSIHSCSSLYMESAHETPQLGWFSCAQPAHICFSKEGQQC